MFYHNFIIIVIILYKTVIALSLNSTRQTAFFVL